MPAERLPHTATEFLAQRLAETAAATRALVWDPERRLAAQHDWCDALGRVWQIVPFDGNRVALLTAWRKSRAQAARSLIVAAPPLWNRERVLDLSYVPAIVAELELFVDLRLARVLAAIDSACAVPAEALTPVAALVADRLDRLVVALRTLRAAGATNGPLNRVACRAAALATLLTAEQPATFLPERAAGAQALIEYLRCALAATTPPEALPLLLELARERLNGPLGPVLELPFEELAAAVYLMLLANADDRPAIAAARVAAHGSGTEGLAALQAERGALSLAVAASPAFLATLEQRSTRWFDDEQLAQLVLGDVSAITAETVVMRARTLPPRAAEAVLATGVREVPLDDLLEAWQTAAVAQPVDERPLAAAFTLLAAVYRAVEPQPPDGALDVFIEAWLARGMALAEVRLEQTRERIRGLPAASAGVLDEGIGALHRRLREAQEQWDQQLAALLSGPGALAQYHRHPRALAYSVRDLLPELPPDGDARALFLVVLSGLRFDSWQTIVRPELQRTFVVEHEEWRLGTLPGIAAITRTSLIAGSQPDAWGGTTQAGQMDERALLAQQLGIMGDRIATDLLVDLDAGQRAVRASPSESRRKRFNLLEYDLCEETLLGSQGALADLQRAVARSIRDLVLPDLQRRVQPGDALLLTGDHGFIQLEPSGAVPVFARDVAAGNTADIHRRYLAEPAGAATVAGGIAIDWDAGGHFLLAVGRCWFRGPDAGNAAFASGGVSLPEVVVPAARLRLAVSGTYRLTLRRLDPPPIVVEGEAIEVVIAVQNAGNQALRVRLAAGGDATRVEPEIATLSGGEACAVQLQMDARKPGTYRLELHASFGPQGTDEQSGEELIAVAATVQPDRRRVEFSNALDIFE